MRPKADDQKLRVLEALPKAHREHGHWLTMAQIRVAAGNMDWPVLKLAVYGLAADGFLFLRDGDNEKQLLLVQLRKEYRK